MSFLFNEVDTNLRLQNVAAIQRMFFEENTALNMSTLDEV